MSRKGVHSGKRRKRSAAKVDVLAVGLAIALVRTLSCLLNIPRVGFDPSETCDAKTE